MLSELSRANFDAILPKVQTYSTVCDSSLGRIGSLLLGSVAERCQQVSQAVSLEVGSVLVIMFSVAAVLCVVFVGIVYVLKDEQTVEWN